MEHEGPSTGDMYALKAYLEAKYMENPHADFEALTQDFMHKYYGKAADTENRITALTTEHCFP